MAADNDTDRLERLIASNEAAANAINRLVQVLERKEQPRIRAKRARREVTRTAELTPRAQEAADRAIARLKARGA